MPRELIKRTLTPLYDQAGKLRVYQEDRWSVETPAPQAHQPRKPRPAPQPPQPPERPIAARRQPPAAEQRATALRVLTLGVPAPPATLDEVLKVQRELGSR